MKSIRWLAPVLFALAPASAFSQVVEPGAVVETAPAAAEPAAEVQPVASPAAAEAPKKVCRLERLTGSSMKRRVCLTQDEAEADRSAARNLMNDGRRLDSAGEGIR